MNKKIEFLKGVSDYLWSQTDEKGKLFCRRHGTEHTGKNVYSIVVDLKLFDLTGEELYFERAKERAFRTVENLVQDPDYSHWIFYPGRLGKRNLSNSVIDCGACVDALSSFYLKFSHKLSEEERGRILESIEKVSETYLKKAVVRKEITNQRLWGATGLAVAYKILKKQSWKEACLKSIERSLAEQNSDGSFQYHPNWKEYNAFEGISDVTPYYHSRHLAFIYYILETLDVDVVEYRDSLIKGCDFLIGVLHPDGVKEMSLDAKRYYWNPYYEVASNSFDVFALVKTYELTSQQKYLEYARLCYDRVAEHQQADGGISGSRFSDMDFKCRIFVNAHTAWLSRVIDEVPLEIKDAVESESLLFNDAGLYKFRNKNYCTLLRFRKKPLNITWGSLVGGGSLIYFGTKEGNWINSIRLDGLSEGSECNFVVYPLGSNVINNIRDFFKNNTLHDIKFRLYLGLVEFLGGKYLYGLVYPLRKILWPLILWSRNSYTSYWGLGAKPQLKKNEISFKSDLARRDGSLLECASLTRSFKFSRDHLNVIESINVEGRYLDIIYTLPKNRIDLDIVSDSKYILRDNKIVFTHPINLKAKIRYALK